jgi:hypothetical protein
LKTTVRAVVSAISVAAISAFFAPGSLVTANADPTMPVVSVAGDIACGTTIAAYNNGDGTATQCRQKYTAALLLGSDAVWTLGDHVYPTATTSELNTAYGSTWGQMKAVTYPTPGDHDYGKLGGSAYFSYFDRPPYYSFDIGDWHVISLNSEIDHSDSSTQLSWLVSDLASTSAQCVAAFWGTPRWTSGRRAPGDASLDPFWQALYAAHADIILSGDTHNYERFARQTPLGTRAADGIRQFVVGTGGRNLVGFPHVQSTSEVRKKAFGVLRLVLRPDAYDWQFVDQTWSILDSGSETCD